MKENPNIKAAIEDCSQVLVLLRTDSKSIIKNMPKVGSLIGDILEQLYKHLECEQQ